MPLLTRMHFSGKNTKRNHKKYARGYQGIFGKLKET